MMTARSEVPNIFLFFLGRTNVMFFSSQCFIYFFHSIGTCNLCSYFETRTVCLPTWPRLSLLIPDCTSPFGLKQCNFHFDLKIENFHFSFQFLCDLHCQTSMFASDDYETLFIVSQCNRSSLLFQTFVFANPKP
jgi:hypothetical protein